MNRPEAFRVLGLPYGASEAAIHRAYRKLARRHHPDVNPGDEKAEEKFIEVQKAFEELTRGGPKKAASAGTYVHFYRHRESPLPRVEESSLGCLAIAVLPVVGYALVTMIVALFTSVATSQILRWLACFGVFVVWVLALFFLTAER